MKDAIEVCSKPISPLQGGVFITLLLGCVFALVMTALNEFAMLERIKEGAALVKVRNVVFPLLSMVPAFLVLAWGIVHQVKQTMTVEKQKKGLVFIGSSFPIFLLVWLIYNTQVMGWLESQGYSQCTWYSGASMGAAKVMVSKREFCIKEGYQVRIDLLDWFEAQHQSGQKTTVKQARNKQSELLAKHKARFDLL